MKILWHSFLLTLQFFTAVPIHKELQLTTNTVTGMMCFLPWTGAIGGAVNIAIVYAMMTYTDVSSFLIAFIVLLWMAIFTGGLHLDGFIDTGDAFFSYRDVEKRLEILSDPRVGAFGVLSIVFLLLGKFVVLNEILLSEDIPLWAFALLPLLARIGMVLFFVTTRSSKESGLGTFFKQRTNAKVLLFVSIVTVLVAAAVVFYISHVIIFGIMIALLLFVLYYRHWALKNFHGLSGDLLGAFIEGAEFLLWVLVLLFI